MKPFFKIDSPLDSSFQLALFFFIYVYITNFTKLRAYGHVRLYQTPFIVCTRLILQFPHLHISIQFNICKLDSVVSCHLYYLTTFITSPALMSLVGGFSFHGVLVKFSRLSPLRFPSSPTSLFSLLMT